MGLSSRRRLALRKLLEELVGVERAHRIVRCGGGLVYDAKCRANGRTFEFSRCECGRVHIWFEVK